MNRAIVDAVVLALVSKEYSEQHLRKRGGRGGGHDTAISSFVNVRLNAGLSPVHDLFSCERRMYFKRVIVPPAMSRPTTKN